MRISQKSVEANKSVVERVQRNQVIRSEAGSVSGTAVGVCDLNVEVGLAIGTAVGVLGIEVEGLLAVASIGSICSF